MTTAQPGEDRHQAYWEYVARVVAAAPPLSAAQRERLRSILGTSAGPIGVEPPSPHPPSASPDAAGPFWGVTQSPRLK